MILSAMAVLCLGLFGVLLRLAVQYAGSPLGIGYDTYTAASLLDESIGGYVLTAVLAFMAGITVTVLCIKYRERPKDIRGSSQNAAQRKNPDHLPENKGE